MVNYYAKAYKKGIKQYKECVSKGEYPFLPALDAMLPLEQSVNGIDLGMISVPLELIVGTKTVSRTNDFANNFMPIASEGTEFSVKWENLCNSHLEEGIRDPIIVWEFLNRFYVQEGNKRVSVLKYFNAVNVLAHVRRILPRIREGNELYFEFLEFNKSSTINFIEFSKAGSYKLFSKLIGKEINEKWNDEEIKQMTAIYYSFKAAYKECGGESLQISVGDALLAYLQVYKYDTLKNAAYSSIVTSLNKIWKDITLKQENDPIEVKLDPETPKKKIIPTIVLKKRKIAFIFGGEIKETGWRAYHLKGINQVASRLAKSIETVNFIVQTSVEDSIDQAIKEGASIIFATESNMMEGCIKAAGDYPMVKIFNCALNVPSRLVQFYYPRMYEAKFISGAIAGAMTQSNQIGYICKYPIYGTIAEINAFARGVQMTNPDAKILLEWSNKTDLNTLVNKLIENRADLISFREYMDHTQNYRSFGLAKIEQDTLSPLVLPMWNWGTYYEKIIQAILDGTMNESMETEKSLNYYWGISSGVVGIVFSEKLPKGVRYLGEMLLKLFELNQCQPFFDPVQRSDGNYIWEDIDKAYSIETIISMDFLEENIIGRIPVYNELDASVQSVVDEMGVSKARKDELIQK